MFEDYDEDGMFCDGCGAALEEGRSGYCDDCIEAHDGAQSEYDTPKGKTRMSNSPNSSGRRRAGRIWGYGPSKGWGRRHISRVCRRQGKRIARNGGEERRGRAR